MDLHLAVELEEHYERFIERSLGGGCVWAAECSEGFLSCVSHDGEQPIIPFWSDAAYARRALANLPLDGYSIASIPLRAFLNEIVGSFQWDDALVGPNFTRDLAGLELDPREVFEELRSRMSDEQRVEYREALETASILSVGHPIEKFERRIDGFARIMALDPNAVAFTLMRADEPVQIDVRARPGGSLVPLWSSETRAERARRFVFGPDDPVRVVGTAPHDFLRAAEENGWSIGVEPTVGLACAERLPRDLLALLKEAAADAAAQAEEAGED